MSHLDPTRAMPPTGSPAAESAAVAPIAGAVGVTQQMPATGLGGDAYRTQLGATITCPVCKATTPVSETYCGDCGFLLASAGAEPIEVPAEETPAAELVDMADGRRYRLREGINTLGRQGTDVLVNEGTVSRHHARIVVENGQVTVEDLGSSNGTKVGDRRIPPNQPTPAVHGMPLKFGNCRVTLEIAGAGPVPTPGAAEPTVAVPASERTQMAEASQAQPAPEQQTGPMVATLQKIEGPSDDIPVYTGTMTIGRRAGNTVSLPKDPYISGRHATIVTDNTGTYLIDEGSTNGTVVNGQRLAPGERQLLLEGDEVQLGQSRYRFVFSEQAPVEGAPPASAEAAALQNGAEPLPDEGEAGDEASA